MCVRVCLFVSVFMVFFHYISEENKLLYMEVSALDATNVNVAFETLFSGKQLRLANFNVMYFPIAPRIKMQLQYCILRLV